MFAQAQQFGVLKKMYLWVYVGSCIIVTWIGHENNRCGRVMADNIAYAKFRKTLQI